MLDAVPVDADRDMRGLVPHMRAVTDLHHQCVQIDDRIEGIQRPALPNEDLGEDLVGDLGDRFVAEFGANSRDQMMLNIADRHPAGIKRNDHVIEATEST